MALISDAKRFEGIWDELRKIAIDTEDFVHLFNVNSFPSVHRFTWDTRRAPAANWVILDDYSAPIKRLADVRLVLEDKRFPETRVEVHCEEESKKDPRNPNPKAKPRKLFVIYTGENADKKFGSGQSLERIVARARGLHEANVKKRLSEMSAADPAFGMF